MTRAPLRPIVSVLAVPLVLAALVLLGVTPAHAVTPTGTPNPEAVLMVKTYKTQPPNLTVGGRFKLALVVDNVVNVAADNVVITVGAYAATSAASATTTSATAPTPDVVVLGSNTRYLGTMAGNATGRSITFDLVSSPRSLPGPYSVPVTIQFDSTNGGRITSVQSVGLAFTRLLAFDVGALNYPRAATVGQPFHVSVSVQNTNAFPVNGVSLSFEATNTTWVSSNVATVGTLDPGKAGSLDTTGIPQVQGQLSVTMAITYQDDYNQTKEIRRNFAIPVSAKPLDTGPGSRASSPSLFLVLLFKSLIGLGG